LFGKWKKSMKKLEAEVLINKMERIRKEAPFIDRIIIGYIEKYSSIYLDELLHILAIIILYVGCLAILNFFGYTMTDLLYYGMIVSLILVCIFRDLAHPLLAAIWIGIACEFPEKSSLPENLGAWAFTFGLTFLFWYLSVWFYDLIAYTKIRYRSLMFS
jgi:hypothetical protein